MTLMSDFEAAKQALYDHVGFVEDWAVFAIDDRTEMFWMLIEGGDAVRFAETREKLFGSNDKYYEDDVYMQRFYPRWVYRGPELTMVMVDTHVDGNKFFAFYDNAKEEKEPD